MKAVVFYYSLNGHTKCAAEAVARKLGADLVRLEPKRGYPKSTALQMVVGGFASVIGSAPKLKPYKFARAKYDVVVLASPVWAGKYAPPMKRFLLDNELMGKRVGLIACCAGGSTQGCFDAFRKKVKGVAAELRLVDPTKETMKEHQTAIDEFCGKLGTAG